MAGPAGQTLKRRKLFKSANSMNILLLRAPVLSTEKAVHESQIRGKVWCQILIID
ncbi:hypothetical protein D1AOALGA4SA_5715 [Olavius algarvensis Delta 1 endosymbiont]|nr:hypothetical protein D1AOALGA4SA_5715 [Olavius algarvensis Delta 1 endosymbiont]